MRCSINRPVLQSLILQLCTIQTVWSAASAPRHVDVCCLTVSSVVVPLRHSLQCRIPCSSLIYSRAAWWTAKCVKAVSASVKRSSHPRIFSAGHAKGIAGTDRSVKGVPACPADGIERPSGYDQVIRLPSRVLVPRLGSLNALSEPNSPVR